MMEMQLNNVSGVEINEYPLPVDTAMGPDTLIGSTLTENNTKIAGFYGEVPASELITGNDLASMIGLTNGTAQNSDTVWLKFILDGKILFIPKVIIRHTVSWDHINAVNAVYGDRELEILGYQFKIRLIQSINPGESVARSSGYDIPITHQSEWNRLFYPISVEHTNTQRFKASQIGPNWVNYTQEELNITTGNGRYTWCQETPNNGPTVRACRGGNAVTSLTWNSSSLTSVEGGWRPVLELVS